MAINPDIKNPDMTWPDEPLRLKDEDVDPLLLWCVKQGSSDISFQTDRPLYNEIDGVLRPGTKRPLDSADLSIVMTKIYGTEAMAQMASGTDLDLSYEIRPDRKTRVRFRVNMTPILVQGRNGVQITMRTLPNEPPTLDVLGIEDEIRDNWAPRQGLVLITGPTGSGKSTLLAAGNRMLIEREEGCGKMLTYESPIEYTYDTVTSDKSLVAQSEIPRHLKTFSAGIRNALRRKPEIILVGEARDRETMAAAIEAGQTGHAVYSTVHTMGVASTIRRMVGTFEPEERTERAYALMETLRMIVTQALVPKIGGGRQGVREWMIFSDDLREKYLGMHHDDWAATILQDISDHGQTMAKSAKGFYEENVIEKRHYLRLANATGA